jgi:hypothetical protein
MKALYIIKLTRNPVPWIQTAPKAIAMEFMRAAAAELGRASIRFEANGAIRRRGYAGKTQIGVMVWIGKVLEKNEIGLNLWVGIVQLCLLR